MNDLSPDSAERQRTGARSISIILIFIALYIPSRLILLFHFTPIGSDVDLYARYAWIHEKARETGVKFYDLYRSTGLKDSSYGEYSIRDLTQIPYPPLAIRFLTVPTWFILNGGSTDATGFEKFVSRYQRAYRILCVPFDLFVTVLALWLVFVLYHRESIFDTFLRSATACGAAALLPHFLYDRLDIVLTALLLASLVALLKKRWIMAFALFALAVTFKPLPVFLFPLWVIVSLPWTRIAEAGMPRRIWFAFQLATVRCGVLALAILISGAISMAIEGWEGLDFLRFHGARGIHVESSWGTFSMLVAWLFHIPMKIFYDFGAYNVETSWTSVMTFISPYFLAIGTGGLCLWIFLRAVQKRDSSPFLPKTAIFLTVVVLGLTFGTFKMFSPQFLLLMVPLVSVVPLRGIALLGFCTVFAGACCTSTYIYPYFYVKEILQGPTPFGLFLLAARELMVLTLPAVGIAIEVVGRLGIVDLHRYQTDSLPVADAPCHNHPQ